MCDCGSRQPLTVVCISDGVVCCSVCADIVHCDKRCSTIRLDGNGVERLRPYLCGRLETGMTAMKAAMIKVNDAKSLLIRRGEAVVDRVKREGEAVKAALYAQSYHSIP